MYLLRVLIIPNTEPCNLCQLVFFVSIDLSPGGDAAALRDVPFSLRVEDHSMDVGDRGLLRLAAGCLLPHLTMGLDYVGSSQLRG